MLKQLTVAVKSALSASQLQTALEHHQHIEAQLRKLTRGKRLHHRKIVSAYDDTIAPIIKGKSNCPMPFGRKPGLLSEPTIGFIYRILLRTGLQISAKAGR